MKKRNNIQIMQKLSRLVKPLAGYMAVAILMGLIGNLCATFIAVIGGYAILQILGKIKKHIDQRLVKMVDVLLSGCRGAIRSKWAQCPCRTAHRPWPCRLQSPRASADPESAAGPAGVLRWKTLQPALLPLP